MRNKFIKCDLPSAKYPSSSGNKQLTSLISAPPVLSLDILTSYALVGFPPVSNWASGMVECLAGREEGKAIVKPSKRLGSNYIFTRSRRSAVAERKGWSSQSVSPNDDATHTRVSWERERKEYRTHAFWYSYSPKLKIRVSLDGIPVESLIL